MIDLLSSYQKQILRELVRKELSKKRTVYNRPDLKYIELQLKNN